MKISYVDVAQQIAEAIPELPPQQKKAAQYLLDNPEDVGLKSMRSLAHEAGVKPATISRLAKTLGFDEYNALRAPFKHRLRKAKPGYSKQLQKILKQGDKDAGLLIDQVRDQDIENINLTLSEEQYPILHDAVNTIRSSRRVYVLGLRGSYSPAFLFHYAYQLFRDNSQLLDSSAGMFADQLRGINSQDCMLVTSFSPYTQMTIDAVEYAVEAGVKIIAITDKYTSPVAQAAEHTIITYNNSPSFFQSFTGALAVNHALINLLVSKTDSNSIEIVKQAEKQLSSISAYW